jgi:hypothetical protein
MHPLLGSFIRLTLIIAVALIALKIVFVLAIGFVIPAAILAGLVVGGLFLYNMVRRRTAVPVIRQ